MLPGTPADAEACLSGCPPLCAQVTMPWPAMMHDTAITERYKIILHFPLCFDPSVRALARCGARRRAFTHSVGRTSLGLAPSAAWAIRPCNAALACSHLRDAHARRTRCHAQAMINKNTLPIVWAPERECHTHARLLTAAARARSSSHALTARAGAPLRALRALLQPCHCLLGTPRGCTLRRAQACARTAYAGPARIGLVPRTAAKNGSAPDIKWFELPSFMSFHVANAWEEEDGRFVKVREGKGGGLPARQCARASGAARSVHGGACTHFSTL